MIVAPKHSRLMGLALLNLTLFWLLPVNAQTLPVKSVTLPNGHQVHVVEKRDQPIVTIDTWVKTGSKEETAENNGVSHFLEHLIFKGTPSHKAGEIDRIVESRGAIWNAATSSDFTHYYMTLPSSFFSQALALHADMLLNAVVPPDELNRERPVVQEEINRSTDNPRHQLYDAFLHQLFPGHGYSLDTLGPKPLIGRIPRENILGYYHYWYQPSRFNTVIVGDVSTRQAVAMVTQAFAARDPRALKAAPHAAYTPPPPRSVRPVAEASAHIKGLDTIDSLYWTVGWQAPAFSQLDDVVALDAAMFALGGGSDSRLYRRLVEEKPLVTAVSAYNMTLKEAGTAQIYLETRPEQWPAVSQVIKQELHHLVKNGITADELSAFKTQTLTQKRFEQESTDGLANALGYFATVSQVADKERYIQKVQALTAQQVAQTARRYLALTKGTSMAMAPSRLVNTLLPQQTAWVKALASEDTTTATRATSTGIKTDTVQRIELPEGPRLIINPLSGAQTVTFKLFANGGERIEAKPGLAALAATMLTKGTHSRTAQDINALLEAQGLSLSVIARDDALELTASATQEAWPTLQTLLLDILQQPNLTQAELDKAKTRLRQAINASRDDLPTRASETFLQALYPQHPYGAVGQRVLDSLDGITLDDVRAYLAQSLSAKRLTLVFSGNIPVQPVQTARQLVGRLPFQSSATPATEIAEPTLKPALTGIHEVTLPIAAATRLIQGYQLPGIADENYPVGKVLVGVLGNGMSSRLFTELREKQSLAYEIGASLQPGRQASTLMLVAGTDPKNQAAVQEGFTRELRRLAETPLTPAELQAVKDKLVGQFALAHETPADQAYYLGYYEAMGLGYQFDRLYPEKLKAVTAEQVQTLAQQLLGKPATWAIVRPQTTASTPKT